MVEQVSRFPSGRQPAVPMEPHCGNCGKRLAGYVTAPWSIRCPACKTVNFGGEIISGRVEAVTGRSR